MGLVMTPEIDQDTEDGLGVTCCGDGLLELFVTTSKRVVSRVLIGAVNSKYGGRLTSHQRLPLIRFLPLITVAFSFSRDDGKGIPVGGMINRLSEED
jgi:hypothetical protein